MIIPQVMNKGKTIICNYECAASTNMNSRVLLTVTMTIAAL